MTNVNSQSTTDESVARRDLPTRLAPKRFERAGNFSTCVDDLRFSTASGSERVFRKGLIDRASLATARGTDPSAQVEIFPEKDLNQSPRNWFNLPERFE
jgi:hypothetical protein